MKQSVFGGDAGVAAEAAPRSPPRQRSPVLVASHDAQLRPVLLSLHDRRLPLPEQVFEAAGLEQRLVELSTLIFAQL